MLLRTFGWITTENEIGDEIFWMLGSTRSSTSVVEDIRLLWLHSMTDVGLWPTGSNIQNTSLDKERNILIHRTSFSIIICRSYKLLQWSSFFGPSPYIYTHATLKQWYKHFINTITQLTTVKSISNVKNVKTDFTMSLKVATSTGKYATFTSKMDNNNKIKARNWLWTNHE